jgi:hypothetical protein
VTTEADYDLTALAARAEIADAMFRYCHATDRRRWWLMETVFHPDATAKVSVMEGGTVREFVEQAAALLDPIGPTHHQIGNMQIALEGDVAHVETYITAFHRIPADAPPGGPFGGTGEAYDAVFGARYIDRFERRDGTWRIADHRSVPDFRHYRPVSEGAGLPPVENDPSINVIARWQA